MIRKWCTSPSQYREGLLLTKLFELEVKNLPLHLSNSLLQDPQKSCSKLLLHFQDQYPTIAPTTLKMRRLKLFSLLMLQEFPSLFLFSNCLFPCPFCPFFSQSTPFNSYVLIKRYEQFIFSQKKQKEYLNVPEI